MLSLLHIENVAVIERADIEFGPGMNVLTGETGAGKSIIIDSVGAILGERTSKDIIRTGSASALISAELTGSEAAQRWMDDNGVEYRQGDNMTLLRKIGADGKNSCRVNGIPVSVGQLRELGELLFDIHGQNDGRRLLSEANHRRYLDGFGRLDGLREDYAAAYGRYTEKRDEYDELKRSEKDREIRQAALLREIKDIESVDPKSGEEEALAERRKLLRGAGRITDKLGEAYEAMYGSDRNEGALSLIIDAENAAAAAARFSDSLQELAGSLSDLRYRAEDMTDRLREALDELDFEPGELDRIENRLSALERLSRRYGDAEAAQRRLRDARNELEDVMYLTDNITKTGEELRRLKEETVRKAEELSSERKKAGEKLAGRVEEELRQLSMPSARFSVEITPKGGEGFDSTGMDEVRFLLSANAGEELGRLSRIASGGELSRIMLGMKNVLSSDTDAEVLIFDEVDAGVSGIAAQRVGEKLWSLSTKRQLLCITHLPQIAAMADTHFSIEKKESDGRTYTTVTQLDGEGRTRELARLTGGETVTRNTLLGAGELISSAEKYKEGKGNDTVR